MFAVEGALLHVLEGGESIVDERTLTVQNFVGKDASVGHTIRKGDLGIAHYGVGGAFFVRDGGGWRETDTEFRGSAVEVDHTVHPDFALRVPIKDLCIGSTIHQEVCLLLIGIVLCSQSIASGNQTLELWESFALQVGGSSAIVGDDDESEGLAVVGVVSSPLFEVDARLTLHSVEGGSAQGVDDSLWIEH